MLVFSHIRNTKNVGDLACTPYHYFEFPDAQLVDIDGPHPDADTVIFGGGAIQRRLAGSRSVLPNVKSRLKIAWGVGASQHDSKSHPPAPGKPDLVGVREFGRSGGEYVPCVTCMHPYFDAVPSPTREFVTFFNADQKIKKSPIPDLPSMENIESLEDTLNYVASGETLITNSYHGVYWALLMGRKVVCLPYSSKFYGFKCPPEMATSTTWREAVKKARSYPEYLDECRSINTGFYNKVMELIGQSPSSV